MLTTLTKKSTDTFSPVHPNPTLNVLQLSEQAILKCGFSCYQVEAGPDSAHSPKVWKPAPKTERLAEQVRDLLGRKDRFGKV